MLLIRRDPSPKKGEWPDNHVQEEFRIEKSEGWDFDFEAATIQVDFNRFGRGAERRSDFTVKINWIDVRGFIREFIEMGHHPDAKYLQRILQLAKAMENAGWSPDSPPDEDFWDILPQSK